MNGSMNRQSGHQSALNTRTHGLADCMACLASWMSFSAFMLPLLLPACDILHTLTRDLLHLHERTSRDGQGPTPRNGLQERTKRDASRPSRPGRMDVSRFRMTPKATSSAANSAPVAAAVTAVWMK